MPRHEAARLPETGPEHARGDAIPPAPPPTGSRYLADARDWPSPRRATAHLLAWLAEAEEVRAGLGGRAARRFLGLLYVAEEARAADFSAREDNHRLAASRYLLVARSALAANARALGPADARAVEADPA